MSSKTEEQSLISGQGPSTAEPLTDAQGIIPVFGPARTDEHGRLLMSDEERRDRASAAIRALKAIEEITDESDTPETWEEIFRRIDESRPYRPLFKGYY